MEDNDILDHAANRETDPDEDFFELAGAGKRLMNYLIDTSIIYMLWHLALMATFYFFNKTEQDIGTVYLVLFSVYLPYYIFLEYLKGKTVGKMITGTQVLDEDGYKASFGRIVLRTVCRFIPFEAVSFLFGDAVGWHDLLSKTRVVVPHVNDDQ
ncbi:MAG TPA: RDD family protein [Cytophagales bacterium]|nr:RDD family protein [Cytophagales bacterium]